MVIKKGLGKKNLDVLLSGASLKTTTSKATPEKSTAVANQTLPISNLSAGQYQPRRHFSEESLRELADSIRAQGIIQPIVVRPLAQKNRYEIIAGERRFRAAGLAGLKEVPVVIRDINNEAALAMALIENIQREDLNAIEEAIALQRLMDEFALTHQEVADSVGKSRTTVTNLLRLLTLNEEVKGFLSENKIEPGHAKVLLAISGPRQTEMAKTIMLKGLTVRETEQLIRQELNPSTSPDFVKTENTFKPNVDTSRLERELTYHLGAKAKVKQHTSGKIKLSLQFKEWMDLEKILAKMKTLA